jgi:hypothetical protein
MKREIIFFENHFMDFYLQLSPKAQEKVDFVLNMIATVDKDSRKVSQTPFWNRRAT